jgi:hypothetical protein
MVDKWEAGTYHHVTWSATGDLNKSAVKYHGAKATKMNGSKNFRLQRAAIAYAKKVGLAMGEGTDIGLDLPTGYKRYTVKGGKLVRYE